MINTRQLSSTSYPINFLMVLSVDHNTGATGKTVTVVRSKNGGSFNAASGAVTEIGNGWYSLAGNATDRDTLGELILHCTATGCDPVDIKCNVITQDPFASNFGLSLTNVTADIRQVNGANIVTPNVAGVLPVDVIDWRGSTPNALVSSRVDSSVGDIVAAALAKFFTTNSGQTYGTSVSGSVVKEIAANAAADVNAIASAVWDKLTSALTTVGSIGKLIVDKLALITTGTTISVSSPVTSGGNAEMVAGDDYLIGDTLNGPISMTVTTSADLSGGSAVYVTSAFSKTATDLTDNGDGTWTARFEFTHAQTATYRPRAYEHQVIFTLSNGHVATVLEGTTTITGRITT